MTFHERVLRLLYCGLRMIVEGCRVRKAGSNECATNEHLTPRAALSSGDPMSYFVSRF